VTTDLVTIHAYEYDIYSKFPNTHQPMLNYLPAGRVGASLPLTDRMWAWPDATSDQPVRVILG